LRWIIFRGLLLFSRLFQVIEGDVVFADHFCEFPARLEFVNSLASPGFQIRFRVVDRDVYDQGIEFGARDALDYVQLRGIRQASAILPGLVIKSDRIDGQRTALSPAEALSVPAIFPSVM
jgi:hypothetical protein